MKLWLGKKKNVKLSKTDPRQIRIDKSLATMIAVDSLPLNITAGLGFRNFVETIDSTINIKSRTTITNTIKKEANKIESKVVNEELKLISNQRIHIITDLWSTKSLESVLGIKIQYLNDDFKMINKTLSFVQFDDSHTGVNIRDISIKEFQRHGLNPAQLGVVISDNAKNMLKAFNLKDFFNDKWELIVEENGEKDEEDNNQSSEDEINITDDENSDNQISDDDQSSHEDESINLEYQSTSRSSNNLVEIIEGTDNQYGWDHSGCLAHKIQLVIIDAIKECADVTSLIKTANSIINIFRRSPKWTAILNKRVKKSILSIGKTRWNSIYIALKRLNDVRNS